MKRMHIRSIPILLASLCLTLAATISQGEPAQEPLFISGASIIPGKPNIMLMIDTSGSMRREVQANNESRINIAKQAAKNMVDSLTPPPGAPATVRVGLATYNGTVGGKLWLPVADLDATHASALKSRISGFEASGYTPLATTLLDIGHYFSTRDTESETNELTLYPGKINQTTATLSSIFTHTDGALGLLGFAPDITCRVVTEITTPGDMPADFTPACACTSEHFISGGATTEAAAEDTETVPPIQMLVVGTKPTICTGAGDYPCTDQSYLYTCDCDNTNAPPCPPCSDDTGTPESIAWDHKPTAVSVSWDSDDYEEIEAHEDPNVSGRRVTLTTTTDSICDLQDWRSSRAPTCDDNECYVRGRENGICRVCATFFGTNPESCQWSASQDRCDRAGDQQCPDNSYQHQGCDSIDDTWWDNGTRRACTDMFCMNSYRCRDEVPGETWSGWNHSGRDDRGHRCDQNGDSWCNDWSWRSWSCRDWGEDCLFSSGTCTAVAPETCNCTLEAGTQCVVDYADVTVGTGGDATGGGYCETPPDDNNTGGNLDPDSLCFNPTRYYTVQYQGSSDIMGPYTGAQLNWYFSEHLTFTEGSLDLPTTDTETSDCSTTNEPIENWCQQSFAILISDGLPNKDRTVSEILRDYTGDCATNQLCESASNSLQLPGTSTPLADCGSGEEGNSRYCNKTGGACNLACQNGTKAGRAYETSGSDYLDDVAKALYDMDLRPSLGATEKAATQSKNNLITYAIGFADPVLNQSSVLSDAALLGGGKFFYAADADALANALNTVISDISSQVAASSSVATNSTQIDTQSLVYQGRFDTSGWFGDLFAFPVTATGTLEEATWNAGAEIPDASDRTVLTYNPEAVGTKGKSFFCGNLSVDQKTALGIADCSDATDIGVRRLNYLRGDATHEAINAKRVLWGDETENRSDDPLVALFRNRTRLDINNHAFLPDPWVLGDIVHSNPIFVYQADYLYNALPEGQGNSGYQAFRASIANRRPMLYVGANDGMLHGFDASKETATAGLEIVAYVPNSVYEHLKELTQPSYMHRYFVDGSPTVGDAYLDGQWRTVLVGTTGAGGHGVFALDITEPGTTASLFSGFDGDSVLWELSDQAAPNNADLGTADDNSSGTEGLGFMHNLGFTLPQASIVRMHDGSWVALVANGYSSQNNQAVLYLINLENGHILRAFHPENANESAFTSANGLSTPFAADVDRDRIADYLYAGDLRGNLWKFDVTSSNPNDWSVANNGAPLYVACDQEESLPCSEDHRQSITSRPVVGLAGPERPNDDYMVYFGTGKYFESVDNLTVQTQTFYGIVDNSLTVPTAGTSTRGNLVEQTTASVTVEGSTLSLRTTTDNGCADDGWYTDLPDAGERVTTNPLLHNGRLIFTTLIPPDQTASPADAGDPCTAAATNGGSGWLMELSATCGTPIDSALPPWDINGDNTIDDSDLIALGDLDGDGVDDLPIAPTGRESTVGIPTPPAIIALGPPNNGGGNGGGPECVGGQCEVKVISGSSSNIESMLESFSQGSDRGRKAWYQVY
ncbi:MAG: hypothetical protein C1943_11165 [Halochromatium sp.]|nr:hypothetical protein [Halochromatium sp.]